MFTGLSNLPSIFNNSSCPATCNLYRAITPEMSIEIENPFADSDSFPSNNKDYVIDDEPKQGASEISNNEDKESRQSSSSYSFTVIVSEPKKVSETFTSYTLYKITTETDNPKYSPMSIVHRRYSEFRLLVEYLHQTHRGVFIPTIPEKMLQKFNNSFVEHRQYAFQEFLCKVLSHPKLRNDQIVIKFLQDSEVPKIKLKKNFLTLKVFSKIENDQFFDLKKNQIDEMENQFRILSKTVNVLLKKRSSLTAGLFDVSQSLVSLSECETNDETCQKMLYVSDLQTESTKVFSQATNEARLLEYRIQEYLRNIHFMKRVLEDRIDVFFDWKKCLIELHTQQAKLQKQRLSNKNTAKLEKSIEELDNQEKELKREFESISLQIKEEFSLFDANFVNDFQKSILNYLQSMKLQCEKQISIWK